MNFEYSFEKVEKKPFEKQALKKIEPKPITKSFNTSMNLNMPVQKRNFLKAGVMNPISPRNMI